MQESASYRLGSVYAVPVMLFLTAVVLFIALLQRQHELTGLCLFTIGIMAAAWFMSLASLRSTTFTLRVRRSRLFPGDQLHTDVEVSNAKAWPIHVAVQVESSPTLSADPTDALPLQSGGLLGYQKAAFHWNLATEHRGVYMIGPLQISAGDPFGFFPRQTRVLCRQEIVVYPRLVQLNPAEFQRQEAFGTPGGLSHVRDPVLIQGTRDYEGSEPARHIHWKASARHGKLQTKVFASSHQEKLMFLLDVAGFDSQNDSADFEKILEVFASLAEQKDRQGFAMGLMTNAALRGSSTAFLPPARNPYQISMMMETLARCTMRANIDLLDQLSRSSEIPWGTSCTLFTIEENQSAKLVKAYLEQRRLHVKVLTVDKAIALCNEDKTVDPGPDKMVESSE